MAKPSRLTTDSAPPTEPADASPATAHYPEKRPRRRGKRESEHLELARMTQGALLPPPQLDLPGLELAMRYLPSDDLGGDFCDCFPLETGTVGLYVGDVQGKGVAAALCALLVNGIMRGIHKSGHMPADIICLLNQRIFFRSVPNQYCCLGYAVFDLEEHRLHFCSAGVPFPLLLRDGKVTRLELTGMPVGLFEVGHYDQISIDLLPGDRLLFHSDGVADSLAPLRRNPPDGGQQLERFLESLGDCSAAELAEALKMRLRGNGKRKRPLRDDATFITARVL